ncbi:hypothetical protein [Burkholderia pyrrocinia]|uniref:hypothetical protein n=1 Tax=Burkholderia pyrrocinia TaxID=60550 RepID=UPI0012603367|nr:hypothetical protein [Burkholderia pyrrocinia]
MCAEKFYCVDCIVVGQSSVFGYKIISGQPKIDGALHIKSDCLTNIFQNFSVDIAGATYVGGEVAAHGSCGFFYKRTGDVLNWALMSLDSEPFVLVEKIDGGVAFLSSVGRKWVVRGNDMENVRIL